MNYRIPRAMCLAANYPVKNDPFLDVCACVFCTQMCGYWIGGEFDMDRLVSHSCGQIYPHSMSLSLYTHTHL